MVAKQMRRTLSISRSSQLANSPARSGRARSQRRDYPDSSVRECDDASEIAVRGPGIMSVRAIVEAARKRLQGPAKSGFVTATFGLRVSALALVNAECQISYLRASIDSSLVF
jgi:hypothetical protein